MKPDFAKQELIPAIIQDSVTKEVLMLGYMNEESFEATRTTGKVTFYSRSKKRLWMKGEESGNYLLVQDVVLDCDQDTLLFNVKPVGNTCHLNTRTCFNTDGRNFLFQLQDIIQQRRAKNDEESYVATLFREGIDRIAQKVGEEATEVIIAALSSAQTKQAVVAEASDLVFHLLVLLESQDLSIADVIAELEERHRLR